MSNGRPSPTAQLLTVHLSQDRLSTYVHECGDLDSAIDLYRWNSAVAAAFWESLGHVEVVVRNAFSRRLDDRHHRLNRAGTWLDDPAGELAPQAIKDITKARTRLHHKGKIPTAGQIIAELSFGFWRFLVARRYQTSLWPDLRRAFPYAPDRRATTVEAPLTRLHEFRNRLAHHERVWNLPLTDLYADMLTLLGYLDPQLAAWVATTSRVQGTLTLRP